MASTTVLWIAPEGSLTQDVRDVVLSTSGCRFERFGRAQGALVRVLRGDVSLVLAYLADSGQAQGLVDLLHQIRAARVPIPVVVISKDDDPDLCLELLRLGVADCLPRPLDVSRLAFLVDILTVRVRHGQPDPVWVGTSSPEGVPLCVGDYLFDAWGDNGLWEQLRMVAPLETTVLLAGETGTGKTHLARVLHELSPRKEKPFLAVPCSALPVSLFESELFGHVRGAFTTADYDRVGRLADAEDGTVLLDEVDCVPREAQAKLLRVVEERVFEPVGSTRPQPLRARLIVATNQCLEEAVGAGRFRSDLYYRLKVVDFSLPPLRERPWLIRQLTEKFLADFCARYRRPVPNVSEEAWAALEGHQWPGNVRELRNAAERAVALCRGATIRLDNLPGPIRLGCRLPGQDTEVAHRGTSNELEGAKREAEVRRLVEALHRHNNNRTSAAMELGISRVTLYKKLHRYGLI